MKYLKHALLIILAMSMIFSLTGCGLTVDQVMNVIAPENTPIPGSDMTFEGIQKEEEETVLELTYSDMDGEFCPFFAEKDGDLTVVQLTQLYVLALEGRRSPTEVTKSVTADGSVVVSITLEDNLLCTDGVALTSDDLMFDLYVMLDDSYDGPAQLKTLPIQGLSDYWNGIDSELYSKYIQIFDEVYNSGKYDEDLQKAVEDATKEAIAAGIAEAYTQYDEKVVEAQKALDKYDTEKAEQVKNTIVEYWKKDCETMVQYTMDNYSGTIEMRSGYTREEVLANQGLQVAYTMMDRGVAAFQDDKSLKATSGTIWNLTTEYPTTEDLYNELYAAYNGDVEQYSALEGFGRTDLMTTIENALVRAWASEDSDYQGEVLNISGIVQENEKTVSITLDYCDETTLKTLCDFYIAPLHVYGNTELYQPENNSFGFVRGDLSSVEAKNSEMIGAGEYTHDQTDIRTYYFTPNKYYWLSETEYDIAKLAKQ